MEAHIQDRSNSTILVVDDEPVICRLLSSLLHRQGWTVLTCLDPREGLEVLAAKPVSLIISDIQMPYIDGLEFTKFAKARKPGVPVLLMTGNAHRYTAEQALASGANGYITKPFRQPELIERIKKLLNCAVTTD